jgi:hypothetical protein
VRLLLIQQPILQAPETGGEDGGEEAFLVLRERRAVDERVDGEAEVLRGGGREGGGCGYRKGKEVGREGGNIPAVRPAAGPQPPSPSRSVLLVDKKHI